MRDGVPADPRTIRELLEAIRDRHAAFGLGPNSQTTADAVAALALMPDDEMEPPEDLNVTVPCTRSKHEWREDDWDEGVAVCNNCGLNADAIGLVPDSGVVLDPQHNDTP